MFFSFSLSAIFAGELWSEPQKEDKEAEEPPGEKEKAAVSLEGQVFHTALWEQHRVSANLYFDKKGFPEKKRSKETFWSGEKFVLEAQAEGETLPASVEVTVEGTAYSAELTGKEGVYRGELFEEDMLFQWGQGDAETLSFLFSAVIDGELRTVRKEIVIDDRQPYWMLHRKR